MKVKIGGLTVTDEFDKEMLKGDETVLVQAFIDKERPGLVCFPKEHYAMERGRAIIVAKVLLDVPEKPVPELPTDEYINQIILAVFNSSKWGRIEITKLLQSVVANIKALKEGLK